MRRYLTLLLIIPLLVAWIGNFSKPEKTFESLLSAAKTKDVNNFIECCDLEAMAGVTGTDENKEKIYNSLKEDPYRKKIINQLMGYLSSNEFEIIETMELAENMTILTVSNKKTKESAKLVFTRKNREWKLSNAKLK